MRIDELRGKRLVIFGLGVEGRAAQEALKRARPEANIDVVDEAHAERATLTGEEMVAAASETMVIIRSPGVPTDHAPLVAAKKKGAKVTSAVNIFLEERKGRGAIVGVTGSKGKSTTASLLAHILRAAGKPVALVGNIGEPAIAHLEDPDGTIFVVELSSYQLEDLEVGPDIAIMLNLFVAHVAHHHGTENYWKAKLRLGEILHEDDLLIYHPSFDRLASLAQETRARAIPFPDVQDEIRVHLKLPGEHFVENARAVVAAARALGVKDEQIFSAMETFKGLPHRLEDVGTYRGVTFIDDSIATIPDASVAAIDAFEHRLGAIILGGQDEGYDFGPLVARASKLKQVTVYVLPGGVRLKEMLDAQHVRYRSTPTIEEAVKDVYQTLKPGAVCLLSPGSPSFDQFSDYKERGEKFAAWAREYGRIREV